MGRFLMRQVFLLIADRNYHCLVIAAIRSIFKHTKASVILVTDIDLDPRFFGNEERLQVVINNSISPADTLHDSNWTKTVALKVSTLIELLSEDYQVVLLDADCLVLKNPFQMDLDAHDFWACRRDKPFLRDDMRLDYIGSIFVGNGKRALDFAKYWHVSIIERSSFTAPPFETPALCASLSSWAGERWGILDEGTYSRQRQFNSSTRIVHLKSNHIENSADVLNARLSHVSAVDLQYIQSYFKDLVS